MNKEMLLTALAMALAAAPVFAAGQTATTKKARPDKASSEKASADQSFVMSAARGGMAEVELGKLAADKASSQEVKDFGQKMVDDHSKANDELKSIAESKNITLPTELSAKDKALHTRLSKLSGPAFDRAYMQAMVSDHRVDINEFRHESQMGKDADVKAYASKTLPTLEDHLKMAETADKAVVGTAAKKSSGKTGVSPSRKTSTSGSRPRNSPGRLNASFTSIRMVLPSSRVTVRFGKRCLLRSWPLGMRPTSSGS